MGADSGDRGPPEQRGCHRKRQQCTLSSKVPVACVPHVQSDLQLLGAGSRAGPAVASHGCQREKGMQGSEGRGAAVTG